MSTDTIPTSKHHGDVRPRGGDSGRLILGRGGVPGGGGMRGGVDMGGGGAAGPHSPALMLNTLQQDAIYAQLYSNATEVEDGCKRLREGLEIKKLAWIQVASCHAAARGMRRMMAVLQHDQSRVICHYWLLGWRTRAKICNAAGRRAAAGVRSILTSILLAWRQEVKDKIDHGQRFITNLGALLDTQLDRGLQWKVIQLEGEEHDPTAALWYSVIAWTVQRLEDENMETQRGVLLAWSQLILRQILARKREASRNREEKNVMEPAPVDNNELAPTADDKLPPKATAQGYCNGRRGKARAPCRAGKCRSGHCRGLRNAGIHYA